MGRNSTGEMKMCISLGMDQGFHNWLVYSGQLDKYMDLKVSLRIVTIQLCTLDCIEINRFTSKARAQ
jgi:hypothetical protein